MKNKSISTQIQNKITTPFLYRITHTVILSLVIFCIFLLILYLVGNFQHFLDVSQQTILNVLFYTSGLNLLLTIPVMIEDIIMLCIVKVKTGRIISLVGMILIDIFCVFCILLSCSVVLLSFGV